MEFTASLLFGIEGKNPLSTRDRSEEVVVSPTGKSLSSRKNARVAALALSNRDGTSSRSSHRPHRLGDRAVTARVALGAWLAIGIAMAGCSGIAKIESRRQANYSKKLSRVLVTLTPGRLGPELVAAFKSEFTVAMRTRGVEVAFFTARGALEFEEKPSLQAQARDFQASSVLALDPAGGVVNQFGSVLTANFEGKLIDLELEAVVWRAQIAYSPSSKSRAGALVDELLKALVADGLVGEAPAP